MNTEMNNVELPLVYQKPLPALQVLISRFIFFLCYFKVWPKHLREKLKLMPTDTKLIKDIITKIFW